MRAIYVVMGTRGEYSDREEWPVCAYAKRELADKHADEAMLWWRRKKDDLAEKGIDMWEVPAAELANPWESSPREYPAESDYYVLEVPVRSALPTPDERSSSPEPRRG